MRPEQLTIKAFGPYAETEHIDFTELEGRSMFVISGRTGAGKTTIFDAMTFALYGRASGALRNASDFRSQYADPEQKTEIDFSFTIRDERYRIVRQPQQPHPKNKTPIPHEAVLYEWKEAWKPMATKVNEVEQTVESLLQLDYEQFSQILLLPQNQFRQLLDSDSMKKQQILQSIFKTEAYRAFQEKWIEKYGKYRKQVEWAIETTRLKLLELEDESVESIADRNIPDIIAWLGAREATLLEATETLRLEKGERAKRFETARDDVETANQLLGLFRELEEQATALASYEAGEAERKNRRTLIEQLEASARVRPLYERFDTSRREVERLEREVTSSRKRLDGFVAILSDLQAKSDQVQTAQDEVDQIQTRLKSINEMLPFVDEWQTTLSKRDELKRMSDRLGRFADETRLGELRKQEETLSRELEIVPAPERLVEAERAQERLSGYAQLEQKQLAVSERLAECERKGKEAGRLYEEQSSIVARFVEAEHAMWADRLSATLVDGEPCPVCGSLTHGAVMRADKSSDQGDYTAATEVLKQYESALFEARADYRALKQHADELSRELEVSRQNLKLVTPIHEALEGQAMLVRSLREAEQARMQRERAYRAILTELKQLEAAKRSQTEERQALLDQLQTVQERLQTMRQPDVASMAELTNEQKRLTDKLTKLQRAITDYERQLEEANRLKWSEEERIRLLDEQFNRERSRDAEIESEFNQALAERGLERQVFLTLIERIDEVSALRDQLAKEQEQGIRLKHSLEALTAKIGGAAKPDIERLHELLTEARVALESVSEQLVTADSQLKRHRQIVSEWNALRQKTDEDRSNLETIKLIADTGRGLNPQKLTFETYVQTAFFDQILYAANIHLDQMTSGQFQLERKIETAKGNAKSGLELLVFDAYTGQSRRVQNLSGGEGFKASLALALGLAEVVQQLSGGVSLETMLIDEGFGTLDAESLDQAIELLMSLQSSGRLVGVISHVQELKDRVDARIEVKKSRSGSTIQLIVE